MKISVPDPCSVPLGDMTPVQGGFYCGSCAKKVTDFRDWSEADIQQYFKGQAGTKSCGIFLNSQIYEQKAVVILPSVESHSLSFKQQFLYALLICFSALFLSCGPENTRGKMLVESPYLDTLAIKNESSVPTLEKDSSATVEREKFFMPDVVGAYPVPIVEEITAGAPMVEIIEPITADTAMEIPITCDKVTATENDKNNSYFLGISMEQMPQFPGGENALNDFIRKNIVYPQYEMKKEIQGKVYAKFMVEEDGSITNITILRSVEESLYFDGEVIRVITSMPKWKPGKQGGKATRVWFTLPIDFTLK